MQKPSSYQKLKFKFDQTKEDIDSLETSLTRILMMDEEEINQWIYWNEKNDPIERRFMSALREVNAELTKISLRMNEK